jgi:hypothetical protein
MSSIRQEAEVRQAIGHPPNSLQPTDGIDIVFHTATLHKPHVATHTRQQFIDTNVTGTSAPAQSCYQVATPIPSLSNHRNSPHKASRTPLSSRATSRATILNAVASGFARVGPTFPTTNPELNRRTCCRKRVHKNPHATCPVGSYQPNLTITREGSTPEN